MNAAQKHLKTTGVIGYGVILGLVVFVALSFVRSRIAQSEGVLIAYLAYALLAPVAIAITWYLNKRFNNLRPAQWGLYGRRPVQNFLYGFGFGIIGSISVTVLAASLFADIDIELQSPLLGTGASFISLLLFTLTTAIWEEHLFRGFALVTLLKRGLGVVPACLLSALVFTFPHVVWGNPLAHPLSLAAIFSLGVLMGYGYVLTGSIWIACGLHFAWNLAVEIIQYKDIGILSVPNYPEIRTELEIVEVLVLVVLAVGASWWLAYGGTAGRLRFD